MTLDELQEVVTFAQTALGKSARLELKAGKAGLVGMWRVGGHKLPCGFDLGQDKAAPMAFLTYMLKCETDRKKATP